jgi:hypothetical protein
VIATLMGEGGTIGIAKAALPALGLAREGQLVAAGGAVRNFEAEANARLAGT